MDPIWQRIDSELRARGKGWPWLTRELGYSVGRVGNWKSRGIPAAEHAAIAAALGESTDWLLGLAPSNRKAPEQLSPAALKVAELFDQLRDPSIQLDVFAQIVGVIERAKGR